MPKLSTLGDAAMGVTAGVVSVNGTVPAPLVGSITGDPRWLDDETLIFQVTASGTLAVGLNTIDVNTLTTAFVRAEGENRLAAGGGVWAAFRSIDTGVVQTSLGGSYSGAALGDVGEDGGFALATSYVNSAGVTAYSAAGAQQWSVPDALVFSSPMPVRQGLVAYCASPAGWQIRRIASPGRPAVYAAREDIPYQLIPVTVSGTNGGLWVLEACTLDTGNVLTIRQAAVARGYTVVLNGPTFNVDARHIAPGVVRIAWSTDAEESADALEMMDLTVATGANRTAVISGGAPVWTNQPAMALGDLPTVPGTGLEPGQGFVSNRPPMEHPMIGKDGRVTVPWGQYFQTLSQAMSDEIVATATAPPVTILPAYRSITSGAQTPLFANDVGRFNLFSDTIAIGLNQTEQEITLEVVAAQQGKIGIPGMQGDDGQDGVPGQMGPIGPQGPAGPTGASGNGIPGPMGPAGDDGEALVFLQPQAQPGSGGAAAGSTGDTQINIAGALGVDTGRYTYIVADHELTLDKLTSRVATALALRSGDGSGGDAGNLTITGGASTASSSHGGDLTIAGGSTSTGTSMRAGNITIKTGDAQFTSGTLTITSGAIPAGTATLGTKIVIIPATPTATDSGSGAAGMGVSVTGGPGQADGASGLLNGTAGAGGPLVLTSGVGGAETVASNTRLGGAGGLITVAGGAGGNAPGAGGATNTGGAGGGVLIQSGAGGTGSTANGAVGTIILKVAATEFGRFDTDGGWKLAATYQQMTEMTAPSAGATNSVRIYAEDNGGGKTRLMALFATGAAQQIAIEP